MTLIIVTLHVKRGLIKKRLWTVLKQFWNPTLFFYLREKTFQNRFQTFKMVCLNASMENRLSPLFAWKVTIIKAAIWLLSFHPSSFYRSHIDCKIAFVSFLYCRIQNRSSSFPAVLYRPSQDSSLGIRNLDYNHL